MIKEKIDFFIKITFSLCSGFITYLTLAFLGWEKVAPLCLQLESQGAHKVQEPHNFADENKWWTFPGVELAVVRPSLERLNNNARRACVRREMWEDIES